MFVFCIVDVVAEEFAGDVDVAHVVVILFSCEEHVFNADVIFDCFENVFEKDVEHEDVADVEHVGVSDVDMQYVTLFSKDSLSWVGVVTIGSDGEAVLRFFSISSVVLVCILYCLLLLEFLDDCCCDFDDCKTSDSPNCSSYKQFGCFLMVVVQKQGLVVV